MSVSPAQGYNVPIIVDPDQAVFTKPQPETVIAEHKGQLDADTDAFSPDLSPSGLQPGQQKIFTISICVDTSAILKVTVDGGLIYCCLNDNVQINENCFYYFFVPVKHGDLFNVQLDSEVTDANAFIRIGEVQC